MHLRRVLLLFAIVLGLAAIVASVSRPGPERAPNRSDSAPNRSDPAPRAVPPDRPPATRAPVLRMRARGKAQVRKLRPRRAATLIVTVERTGQVEIGGTGQSVSAAPEAPARFELFETEPRRLSVSFVATADGRPKRVGVLVVEG